MTDYLLDKFKYLDLVDIAPATPEGDAVRAAVIPERAPQKSYWRACGFLEADIIDEQHLLARLKVLPFKDLSEYPDELLMTIILQRALAELKYQFDEPDPFPTGDEEALIALLQSRRSGDWFGGLSEELRKRILWCAISLTRDRIKRCEEEIDILVEFSYEPYPVEPADDSIDSQAEVMEDAPLAASKPDEEVLAKYRGYFREYRRVMPKDRIGGGRHLV